MFGIGITELLVIGVVLLIAVGPNRIPQFVKQGVAMYRQLRQATRDLRASTGIDEILQDEDLRDLRRPLNIPLAKKGGKPSTPVGAVAAAPKPLAPVTPVRRGLSDQELDRECPREGVDLAELRTDDEVIDEAEAARRREAKASASDAVRNAKLMAMHPPPAEGEEYEKVVAAKQAEAARDEEIVASKLAAVAREEEGESDEDRRIIAEKDAAVETDEDRRIIAEKNAAASAREETEDDRRIIAEKNAAASAREESEDDRRIIAEKNAAAEPVGRTSRRARSEKTPEPESSEEGRRVMAAKLSAVAEKAAAYRDPGSEREAAPAPKKKKKKAHKASGASDG